MLVPPVMAAQDGHSPQGSCRSPEAAQLRALARMRAVVVLPTPRGPQNR